jgi:hypothetical protein
MIVLPGYRVLKSSQMINYPGIFNNTVKNPAKERRNSA